MKTKLSLVLSLIFAVSFSGIAQDFDDIYYNSSKSKKHETKTEVQSNITNVQESAIVDNSTEGSMRDVDEYNRRNVVAQYDSTMTDSLLVGQGDFVYTDRIKRFYNPSVISETADPELAELYYVSTTPSVNLIIGTPTYGWDPYWYNWYSPSYSWYAGWYGPRWYSPYYAWDWNWSFGWGWHYPMHYPHWGYGPSCYPGHIHGPVMGGGHIQPTYNKGGRRPFGTNNNSGVSNGRRPVTTATSKGSTSVNGANTGRRPSAVNVNNSSNNNNRPAVSTSSNTNNGRRPAVTQSTNSRNESTTNYNNSSNSSNRRSGFSTGGSRGGFGSGSSSGGGSSRSGRRR